MNPWQVWKQAGAPAKWAIILTLLLVGEVGGILATPALTRWYDAQFHIPLDEAWGEFGTVLWELLLLAVTTLLWFAGFIWWLARAVAEKRDRPGK